MRTENEIGTLVVDCAVRLHRELGPGLLETVYETTLKHRLEKRGLMVERQAPIPIQFDGVVFKEAFRADMIVDGKVIVELKSIEEINNAHKKQLLTYLKLTGLKLAYLLNFGAELIKNGIVRTVNNLDKQISAPLRLCEK